MSNTAVTPRAAELQARNRRLAIKCVVVVFLMVGFTPVLWYTGGILCDWAGIGINPGSPPRSEIRMGPPLNPSEPGAISDGHGAADVESVESSADTDASDSSSDRAAAKESGESEALP